MCSRHGEVTVLLKSTLETLLPLCTLRAHLANTKRQALLEARPSGRILETRRAEREGCIAPAKSTPWSGPHPAPDRHPYANTPTGSGDRYTAVAPVDCP